MYAAAEKQNAGSRVTTSLSLCTSACGRKAHSATLKLPRDDENTRFTPVGASKTPLAHKCTHAQQSFIQSNLRGRHVLLHNDLFISQGLIF
jgi:hypothetical protein